MKNYAMVLLDIVIDIVYSDTVPEYPPDPLGNIVIAIECNDIAKLGMSYKDGIFVERIQEPVDIVITENEIIMQAMADAEIRDFDAHEERKLLAQKLTDIELILLGGNT